MNKIIFVFTAIVSTLATNMAWSATTVDCISCTDASGNCTSYGSECCAPCNTGGNASGNCDQCKGLLEWTTQSTSSGSSYETKCNGKLSYLRCLYSCSAKSYGNVSASNLDSCQNCPLVFVQRCADQIAAPSTPVFGDSNNDCLILDSSWSGDVATSDIGNNANITDCYLSQGTYKDGTGVFKLLDDCHYTE